MYSGQADPAPTCNEYPMCMYSGHPQGMPLQKNIHHKSYIKHHNYEQYLGKNLENRNHRIDCHRDHLRPAGMHLTQNSKLITHNSKNS